ncbi:MAG TPA: DUF6505 family protein [Paracoccaceae bacterium]|mgnify:CR=1 FL=1|nr:DUF6505 family protein [Paracoccaceae bacterium]HMO70368.1 DUF6505 family protein [Paracoccaceae bacterium]
MTKLPRTIRLDPSDTVVFPRAAEPGEWAVPGTFLFAGRPVSALDRKTQIAFRSGFLGLSGWGFSTLVTVAEARAEERRAAVDLLALQLVVHLGAPDEATARPAAEEEIALAEDLCRPHPPGMLMALHRAEDAGGIVERFRTLRPRDQTAYSADYLRGHGRAFEFFETDEDETGAIDLRNIAGGQG